MRRRDRELSDTNEKLAILHTCKVCRIGLSDNNMPYIVPLNYGYTFENNIVTLFFHSAMEGKKLDILKRNNNACFEVDCDTALIESADPCAYGYAYKSIIGFGKIIMLERLDEKKHGLQVIMKHQTEKDTVYDFSDEQVQKVCVYKMIVDEYTGKQRVFIDKS